MHIRKCTNEQVDSTVCVHALLGNFGDVPDLVSVVTGDLAANKLNAEEDASLVFRERYAIAPLRATTHTRSAATLINC
jgi:hypothetical protein